jgi:uncharacterized protein
MSAMTQNHKTNTPIITDYDQNGFTIDHVEFRGAVAILGADEVGYAITDIKVANEATISADDLNIFSNLGEDPHLLIIGIGATMSHPFMDLRKKCQQIGLKGEILPTGAACRTWNLLLSEGRKVAMIAVPASKKIVE